MQGSQGNFSHINIMEINSFVMVVSMSTYLTRTVTVPYFKGHYSSEKHATCSRRYYYFVFFFLPIEKIKLGT
jgi:hypothetical protein